MADINTFRGVVNNLSSNSCCNEEDEKEESLDG
jgi:hypothetical protein